MTVGVDGGRGGSVRVSVGGGPGPLLMRPVADGKKLFLWREVLVLTDLNLLPEGSVSKSICPGWEGSNMIFLARLGVLEACRSWRDDGRLQPITFSAWRMIRCSLLLSLTVAAAY